MAVVTSVGKLPPSVPAGRGVELAGEPQLSNQIILPAPPQPHPSRRGRITGRLSVIMPCALFFLFIAHACNSRDSSLKHCLLCTLFMYSSSPREQVDDRNFPLTYCLISVNPKYSTKYILACAVQREICACLLAPTVDLVGFTCNYASTKNSRY